MEQSKYKHSDKLPLSLVVEELEKETGLTEKALHILSIEDSDSTYTPATAISALIHHWLVNRDLNCYINGKLVDDFTALTVFAVDGDYGKGEEALENWVAIRKDELAALLEQRNLTVPAFLRTSVKAQTDADTHDEPIVKTGRPPTIKIKAEIVRQIIIAIESVAGEKFDTGALPGNAADLLDACQRIERSAVGKILTMGTTLETFKAWLRTAGYSFPNGCPPKNQATFWTHLAPEIVGKINAEVFTGVNPEKSL